MQNNVTELRNRLLRALDSNYNVIDMPSVVEIVSLLEKVTITKELLETTRLGKHVNELRRKTTNDSLSKRAKDLVKKWRNMILPEPAAENGVDAARKRPPAPPPAAEKRRKPNGLHFEHDLMSDNSNSSFTLRPQARDVILINSDSNSSLPEAARAEPVIAEQMPKKRGRKKGSKNHKNLLDEAETSFTNKLAVSRGNSKVKTTQELIASLQNRNSLSVSPNSRTREDLNVRAAKLTERVSIIDQKLNTNANRYKNRKAKGERVERVVEAGAAVVVEEEEDEVVVVDEVGSPPVAAADEVDDRVRSLSVEEALAQLPPLVGCEEGEAGPICTCVLRECDETGDAKCEEGGEVKRYEFVEDCECDAGRKGCRRKFSGDLCELTHQLNTNYLESLNGNWGVGEGKLPPELNELGLYVNVVPNVNNERIPKDVKSDFQCENYQKYNVTECDKSETERTGDDDDDVKSVEKLEENRVFREWHEVLDKPSYNGEILKILPYVIID